MKLHEIRLAIPAALFASLFFICSAYNNKQVASLKEDHVFMRILLWQVFKVWTSFRKNALITYSIGQSDHTLERKLVGPIPISICNYLYIYIYKYDYWVVSIADSQWQYNIFSFQKAQNFATIFCSGIKSRTWLIQCCLPSTPNTVCFWWSWLSNT